MNLEKTDKLTINRKEAAQMLGISVVTLDRELARNKMPHCRVGRRILFTEELLKEYIDQNTFDAVVRRRRNLN